MRYDSCFYYVEMMLQLCVAYSFNGVD